MSYRDHVTLGTLKSAILDQADMTGSLYISDERLQYWINVELQELYDLLVASYSDYFIKRYQITWGVDVAADATEIQLPDDFFKNAKVFYWPGGSRNDMYTAERVSLEELPIFINSLNNTMYSVRYYISGSKIGFVPDPSSGDVLDMWYVHKPPFLEKDSDAVPLSVPVGWEDFVVSGCVARCLAKEESDNSHWIGRKEQLRRHIIDMAEERDEGQPARVVDAYRRFTEYSNEDEWLP